MADNDANEALYERLLSIDPNEQSDSPLFSLLPAEIRGQIFTYALTDYPDPSPDRHYGPFTCYTRPSYFAPRKSDTELLRTCRRAYQESWFMPFTLKEQMHWLTGDDRAPPEYDVWGGWHDLRIAVDRIARQQGKPEVEINSLRVFAQMWKLERGDLATLLSAPGLRPRSVTLTIRHADWWFWEDDEPLRFDGRWLRGVSEVLEPSVREFRVEMESLERKKDQVDKIAKQMTERWSLTNKAGERLYADATPGSWEVSRWSGTSSWHDRRWVRDETEPGRIDYYIVTVTFRPEFAVERGGGKISEEARGYAAEGNSLDKEKLKLELPEQGRINMPRPSIRLNEEGLEVSSDEDEWDEEEEDEDEEMDEEEDEEGSDDDDDDDDMGHF